MAVIEKILGGSIFYDFWKQLQQYLFTEKRLIQLLTLQPIEIYKESTELEIDTCKIQLEIKSTIENLVQRRIDRTLDFLTLNFTGQKDALIYDFDVLIKARMSYDEISKFFNHHFAGQNIEIEKRKYYLTLGSFTFSSQGTKAVVHVPFVVDARWWFFKRKLKGVAVFKGSVNFHYPKHVLKTRNLQYELQSDSMMLRIINKFYYRDLINFLNDFLQYNFSEELFHAKVEAQLQINSVQNQNSWVTGNINDLDLERLTIEKEGVHAVFVAKGKLHIIR